MKNGIKYLLELILDEDRILRLNMNLDHSNHLVRDNESTGKIKELVETELSYVFLLSIPKLKVLELEGVEAYLIRIVK